MWIDLSIGKNLLMGSMLRDPPLGEVSQTSG